MSRSREDYLHIFKHEPVRVAHMVGFRDLDKLHNDWLKQMLYGTGDMTLLAHRLSYKTTCVSVALSMQIALLPRLSTLFMRKTDDDVKEIIYQAAKILRFPEFAHAAHVVMGKPMEFLVESATEIDTSYNSSTRGTSQLVGVGSKTSITGKHFDRIYTDDIVNLEDRRSRAERERVKLVYQELQNIRSHGGRVINTGTPWHKEDTISVLMPNIQRYDCYSTGIMHKDLIEEKRRQMSPSLFAANYELRHIAAENALFATPPRFTPQAAFLRDGIAHIDAAYGGEDYTALTCGRRIGDTLYMYGRLWHAHVSTVLGAVTTEASRLMCAPIYLETNADKGFLGREIRQSGLDVRMYPERMNKYLKISTFLKKWWGNIVWLEGTDKDYLAQIMDYTEEAEHDDAPDSAACICRILDRRS